MRGWYGLLVCLLVVANPLAARVYKYVDASGTVSYTDDLALAAPYEPEEIEYLDPDPDKVKLRYTPAATCSSSMSFMVRSPSLCR